MLGLRLARFSPTEREASSVSHADRFMLVQDYLIFTTPLSLALNSCEQELEERRPLRGKTCVIVVPSLSNLFIF